MTHNPDIRNPVSGHLLIGNSFPMSLIRRRVIVDLRPLTELRSQMRHCRLASFWGHDNTLAIANQLLGVNLAPTGNRPAIELSAAGYPLLNGETFRECWLLSADYIPGFRPEIGVEVPAAAILGWQVMKLSWEQQKHDRTGLAKSFINRLFETMARQ